MNTVQEPTRVMTLADAERELREWQNKLAAARAALTEAEATMGQFALAEGVDKATALLMRLEVEVKRAAAAAARADARANATKRSV